MPSEKDCYRQCASIAVFRATKDSQTPYELLLLHKPRKKDAWQLPQGGVEAGESLQEAAVRELKEEANLSVRVLGHSPAKYHYDFPASYRRFRPDNVCGQEVGFVIGEVQNDAPVQVDGKEINAYAWVKPSELAKHITRKEYLLVLEKVLSDAFVLLEGAEDGAAC